MNCKKNVLLFSLLLVVFYSCDEQNDLKEWNFRGKVKSVKTISYSANEYFGEIEKGDKNGKSSQIDHPKPV